jgi:hypothetical protein
VFEIGLVQRGRREDEVKSFFDCSREAVDDNQQRAAQIAADFEKARRQVRHGTVAFKVMSRRDAANVKVMSKPAYPSRAGENFSIFANTKAFPNLNLILLTCYIDSPNLLHGFS